MLPELLAAPGLAQTLRTKWASLPADAALPTQSVWQHARIASAFAGTGPRPAILVFNIASAQEFLSTARRTQDLWMGSFILSHLCWSGMRVLAEQLGPDCVVVPDLLGQPLVDSWLKEEGCCEGLPEPSLDELRAANLPNVFTAIVPAESGSELARAVEQAVYSAWDTLADGVRTYVEQAAGGGDGLGHELAKDPAWRALWKSQTERFLRPDVFWAIVPWPQIPDDANAVFATAGKLLDPSAAKHVSGTWRDLRGGRPTDGGDVGALYGTQAALAGKALEARKNLRAFTQTNEEGEKCTLCGVRSALRPASAGSDGRFDYGRLTQFWRELSCVDSSSASDGGKLVGRIRRGERLCAVCLTKRLAWEGFFLGALGLKERRREAHVFFPSTSSMATVGFRRAVLAKLAEMPRDDAGRTKLSGSLRDYVDTTSAALRKLGILFWSAKISGLERTRERAEQAGCDPQMLDRFLRLDGDWLYESALDIETIGKEYGLDSVESADASIAAARRALAALLKAADGLGIPRPDTYYALVAMDGDRMGDWLVGRSAPLLSEVVDRGALAGFAQADARLASMLRPAGAASQAALAEAAKTFALHVVPHVVEETHCGRVIYAGGDDVLAFVPLDELMDVLAELRDGYKGGAGGWFTSPDGIPRLAMGNRATISAGVVVAHHAHPFSQVVELTHGGALEDDAKEDLGRDAFSIRVLKRSGEELQAGAKWRCGRESVDAVSVVSGLTRALSSVEERVSDRFIKELSCERALASLPYDAQQAELGRLLQRRTLEDNMEQAARCLDVRGALARLLRGLREEEVAARLARHCKDTESRSERDTVLAQACSLLEKLDQKPLCGSVEAAARVADTIEGLGIELRSSASVTALAGELALHREYDRFLGLLNLARFLSTGRRSE
jgi:CRISPR-associated protein Cmr2